MTILKAEKLNRSIIIIAIGLTILLLTIIANRNIINDYLHADKTEASLSTAPMTGKVSTTDTGGPASSSPAEALLSASVAIASDKPILFVFQPVEACAIHYCLTADAVQQWVTKQHGDQISVVGVPVYAAHIYNNDTPPPLFVDWDLYPVNAFAEWLPQAELTDAGWGLKDTHVVFVTADQQSHYHFENGIDFTVLNNLLSQ